MPSPQHSGWRENTIALLGKDHCGLGSRASLFVLQTDRQRPAPATLPHQPRSWPSSQATSLPTHRRSTCTATAAPVPGHAAQGQRRRYPKPCATSDPYAYAPDRLGRAGQNNVAIRDRFGLGLRWRRYPRPRHAGVTRLIRNVVRAVSTQILGLVRIVLQRRDRADEIPAGLEHVQHRPAVRIADQPGPHLVPATHSAALRDALVVSRPERDAVATRRAPRHALADRRAAVTRERRWVKNPVGNAIAVRSFAFADARAYLLGGDADAFIG